VNLGAEPKKVAALVGVLVLGAVVVYYANSDGSGSSSSPRVMTQAPVTTQPAPGVRAPGPRTKAGTADRRQISNRATATAWNPRLGTQNPEDRPDPATVDPALKMDLLAKVQAVELGAPGRNLFLFGAAPPAAPTGLPKAPLISTKGPVGPMPPPGPPPPIVAAVPSAPPMNFKYYGFKVSRSDGHKAAFLLDGEEILIGGENDIFKKHYRIVRINAASIVIEDTDFKSTQTLPLQENQAG
jgi:hypothetical protein